MKKIKALLITATLFVSVLAAGCGAKEPAKTDSGVKTYSIGLCNFVDDASLNQIVKNIEERLAEIETAENVKFDINYDNCNADANVLAQIVSNFEAEGVDLMIGIATPVAIQMQAATETSKTPVVFAAVSDPVGAALVDSLEKPGANITGTSDFLNTEAILNIIFANDPSVDKVGLLYDAGQDASTLPINDAMKYLENKGVEYVVYTATNVDETMLAADSLVADGVDAVFTPTDNTIMQAELSIYEKFAAAGIPHYCGADSFALNGAFLGYGVDYAALGRETADMVADILLNKKDIANVAVKTFDNGAATINTETCTAIGLDFESVKDKIKDYCTVVNGIETAEEFD